MVNNLKFNEISFSKTGTTGDHNFLEYLNVNIFAISYL